MDHPHLQGSWEWVDNNKTAGKFSYNIEASLISEIKRSLSEIRTAKVSWKYLIDLYGCVQPTNW